MLNGSDKEEQQTYQSQIFSAFTAEEMDGKTYRELLSTSMKAIPKYNEPIAKIMINQIKDLFEDGDLGRVRTKEDPWYYGGDKYEKMSLAQRSAIIDSINAAIHSDETIDPAQGKLYIKDLKKNMTKLKTYQDWMRSAKVKALMMERK